MARRGAQVRPAPADVALSDVAHQKASTGVLAKLPADWLPIALVVGDAVVAAISVPFGYWVKYNNAVQALPFQPYLAAIPVVVVIYLLAMAITGQYRSWRGRTLIDQLFAAYAGIGLAAVLIFAAIELGNLGASYSRLTIVPAVALAAVLMTAERYLLRQFETRLRRRGIGTERVLMVGTGEGSELLIRRMSMFPQYGFHVVGVATDELTASSYLDVPVVGRVGDLPSLVTQYGVDQVFLALPASQRERLLHLIKLCEDAKLEFKIVPDLLEIMSTRVDANAIDGLPLVGIRRSQLRGWTAAVKRATDIVVASVMLAIFSPVLLVAAILIKVTMPGPILFRQERIGKNRRPFVIYKFRSMIPDAESKTGPVVAKPGDDRVTPLGRFLRRSSIDELPQLFNVLKGDMSLVGPRPQPTFFDERYSGEVPRYLERSQVRPGLTGWAEVNDLRGAAPIHDRTMYDVYYIEHWSLALDLKCIVLTGLRLFTQHHAY
ncbi:MAG TPA: undecaprenyl-phosphate glucose phosphotransferase [Candidatus Dormibacteraeota bacterium]|nr:undecaprenyl-phosphate glucose phosphotransferase [Candidatus Dormibacteraeota bacterium]